MFSEEFSIAWPYFLACAIATILSVSAWQRKRTAASLFFSLCMMAGAGWSFCSGMHLIVEGFGIKLFWVNIKFFFVVPLPVFWLLVASSFVEGKRQINKKRLIALLILPAITVLLIATNHWHNLVFVENKMMVGDGYSTIERNYGPFFWLYTAYAYTLFVSGTLIFAKSTWKSKGHFRTQAMIMMGGSFFPFLLNAAYLSSPESFYFLDYTPVSFSATGIVYFIGLFKYGMLDLVPIARAEIVRSMEDAVIVTNCKGIIIDSNNAAIDLQQSKSSAVGHLIGREYPFLKDSWKELGEQDRFSDEVELSTDQGSVWYRVDIKRISNSSGGSEGRMLILRDISDIKTAQKQLEDAMEKTKELSRLKSRFLASMSHDVRSPLTGIIGFAEVLAEECQGDQAQFAGMIRDSGNKLLKLINSMLSISHLSSGTLDQEFQSVNLVELSRKVLAPVERELATTDVHLEVVLPDYVLEIEQDANYLTHALSHILDFATRNTKTGKIQFALGVREHDVVFRIADTGKGFDTSFVESISKPLNMSNLSDFSSKNETGLGLRVANGLLEEMGGKMQIESQVDRGTVCTISIPKVQEQKGKNELEQAMKLPIAPARAPEKRLTSVGSQRSNLPKSA